MGLLTVQFAKQSVLFNTDVKLYINESFRSKHSAKKGFNVSIPFSSSEMALKLEHSIFAYTIYEITELNTNKDYFLEIVFDKNGGDYNYKITENG